MALSLVADENAVEQLSTFLSADELQRASCFRFQCDRRRFIVARGRLRQYLADYTSQHPSSLSFCYGDKGKPSLMTSASSRVEFNVSHSGDVALYAFSRNRPIGIDVEKVCPLTELEQLAGQCLSRDQIARINQLHGDEKFREFYRCWTRYEALVKCTGEGIATELDREQLIKNFNGSLLELNPSEEFIGALAVSGGDFEVKLWTESLPSRLRC
jgi:4'-phosphopantetheinyl transferase